MRKLLEIGGRRLPFLRWSAVRLVLGIGSIKARGQVGDGREEALAGYVAENARPGDLDDVIRVIDDFGYHQSLLINVGDEKGKILDAAIQRVRPRLLLELGAYVGYSALRTARVMPDGARLVSVEFSAANAAIARRVIEHAGAADRVTVVEGSIGDGGETMARLEAEHGFGPGALDFGFIDHDKAAYLPDLERIMARGWLHPGSVVVADNIKYPGAPEYAAYMREQEGKAWETTEHETRLEYQTLFKDLVFESRYLG